MGRLIMFVVALLAPIVAMAQNRFPKPDFESGYEYPDHEYAVPNEVLWDVLDVTMLLALLLAATWAVMKKRKPMTWISIVSVLYFGFLREGCVCSVGSIQNVALALVDPSYSMPWNVLVFFLLPVVFALLFGRVFCAGVCPMGALQELVNVKSGKIGKPVAMVLGLLPWFYLIMTLLYALTRSRFIICQFDPFIGIFRLGGDVELLIFGIVLLIISVFTGRPFCRFLCPYGALLSLFSAVSLKRVELTKKKCVNCDLCHSALFALTLFLAVNHDEGSDDLGAFQMLQDLHALTDSSAGSDHILNDNDLFTCLRNIAHEGTAFTVVLHFLAVEEEGQIQPVLRKGNSSGNGQGNAFVCGAVQNSFLVAQLIGIGLGVEFAHFGDLVAGLDHTGIDEIGDLAAGLCGKVAELQNACTLQELNKLSLVSFHDSVSLFFVGRGLAPAELD